MKSFSPWARETECPLEGFQEFKKLLMKASYHHAGPGDEWGHAKTAIQDAAKIAVEKEWPYWVMDRIFREIGPLVEWGQFMQSYINVLKESK